jgi:hypothetical protein
MSGTLREMEPTAEETAPDRVNEKVKQYNRVVRLAKLNAILLEKLDFKIVPDIYSTNKEDLARELTANTEINYDADTGECVASINWIIIITHKKKKLVKCEANYVVIYGGLSKCTAEAVKMFIEHIGKTATYAYFRALYAHLDWSADLGSSPLPVVQFQPRPYPKRSSSAGAKSAVSTD